MRVKPRLTKDKGSDVLRFSLAGLAFIAVIAIYWNRASIPVSDLKEGYQGYVLQGASQQGHIINEEGVVELKTWLEKKTTPTFNPVTIVYHNINYRNNPSNYELVVGLRGIKGKQKFREYAIYQSGKTIYLQIEPIGSDRVLRTTFTADELEKLISLYIEGEFKTVQQNRPHESHVSAPDCSFKDVLAGSPAIQLMREPRSFSDTFFSLLHPPSNRKLGTIYRNKCGG